MKKKITNSLFALAVSSLMCISAFATNTNQDTTTSLMIPNSSNRVCSNGVVFVREDVTREEALNDATFDPSIKENQITSTQNRSDVYWDVQGWSEPSGYLAQIPYGSSAQIVNGKVSSVYHYTRTFLSELLKFGDSGREWGYKTVVAEGTACDQDIWDAYVHHVFYGTES